MATAQALVLATEAGLTVLATGAWHGTGGELPGVAGFISSSFSPLIAETARLAMASYSAGIADRAGGQVDAGTTAVVLVSAYGDIASARTVADAVDREDRVGPLFFYQSVPNAIAGHVATKWGLTGPVLAISPAENALAGGAAEGFAMVAALLTADASGYRDADRALIVFAEQADPGRAGTGHDAHERAASGTEDRGLAVLVEPTREQM